MGKEKNEKMKKELAFLKSSAQKPTSPSNEDRRSKTMTKENRNILWTFICMFCFFSFGLGYISAMFLGSVDYPKPDTKVRSIAETQQQLRDIGFEIKITNTWNEETEAAYQAYKEIEYKLYQEELAEMKEKRWMP